MRWWMLGVVGIVGCGNRAQKDLDDARELWLAEGSDTYTMTVQQRCFCPDTFPVDVEVVASGVRSATIFTDNGPIEVETANFMDWYTVDGLFAQIQAAIDADAYDVSVVYGEIGAPDTIDIDFEQLATDDERGWTVTNLVIDPDGAAGL